MGPRLKLVAIALALGAMAQPSGAPTGSPTQCDGSIGYRSSLFETAPPCPDCNFGFTDLPFQLPISSAEACASLCDSPSNIGFLYAPDGPHAQGCWCYTVTVSPTTTAPSTSQPTLSPATISPSTLTPTTLSPFTTSPTLSPETKGPSATPTASPITAAPSITLDTCSAVPIGNTTGNVGGYPDGSFLVSATSGSVAAGETTDNVLFVQDDGRTLGLGESVTITIRAGIQANTIACLMIRENVTANAIQYSVCFDGNALSVFARTSTGGSNVLITSEAFDLPPFPVSISRSENGISSSFEALGFTFDIHKDLAVPFENDPIVGYAVFSIESSTATAFFDGLLCDFNIPQVFLQNSAHLENVGCQCPYSLIDENFEGTPTTGYVFGRYDSIRYCITSSPTTSAPTTFAPTDFCRPPSVSVEGGLNRTVFRQNTVSITATTVSNINASVSSCSGLQIEFSWSSPSGHDYLITNSNSSTFVINAFTLNISTIYEFEVSVKYKGKSETSTTLHKVIVEPSPPTAIFQRCDRGVSQLDALLVDAGTSFDPDFPEKGVSQLQVTWSCSRGELGCGTEVNAAVSLADLTLEIPALTLELTNGSVSSGLSLDLADDDTPYLFRIDVLNTGTQLASFEICEIWVRPATIPPLWVFPPDINLNLDQITLKVNGTSIEAYNANQEEPSGDVSYIWNCELIDGSECGTLNVLTSLTSSVLVIQANTLMRSIRYRFFVKATTSGGVSASAFADVVLPNGPQPGICQVTPDSGDAFTTNFIFECIDWSGVGLVYSYNTSSIPLRISSPETSFTTTLSIGVTEVFATITDSNGASAVRSIPVTVTLPVLSDEERQELQEQEKNSAESAAESGDLTGTISSLQNSLGLLETSSSEDLASLTQEIDFLIEVAATANANAPDTTEGIQLKVALFESTLTVAEDSGVAISANTASIAVENLENIISTISPDSEITYTPGFGVSVVNTLSRLTNTTSQTGGELSEALDSTISGLGQAMGSSLQTGQTQTVVSKDLAIAAEKLNPDAASESVLSFVNPGASQDSVEVLESVLAEFTPALSILSTGQSYWPADNSSQKTGMVTVAFYDEDGNEIEVTGVNSGIIITIDIDEKETLDPTLTNVCRFWNETTEKWETDGCTATVTETQFICNCTHLTSFQGAQEGATPPESNTITVEDLENLNFDNLAKNPFVLFALLAVFMIYVSIILCAKKYRDEPICPWSSRKDSDDEIIDKLDDFLMQWYFYLPLLSRGVIIDMQRRKEGYQHNDRFGVQSLRGSRRSKFSRGSREKSRDSRKSIRSAFTSIRKRQQSESSLDIAPAVAKPLPFTKITPSGSQNRLFGEEKSRSPPKRQPSDRMLRRYGSAELKRNDLGSKLIKRSNESKLHKKGSRKFRGSDSIRLSWYMRGSGVDAKDRKKDKIKKIYICCCLFPRWETIAERTERNENTAKILIVKRVKKALRRSGGRAGEAWILLRESERRERRFLRHAQMHMESNRSLPPAEIKQVEEMRERLRETRRIRRKLWKKRNEQVKYKWLKIWWKFVKMTHEWIGIFKHRKLDPYSSQWRSNVLLQSLLLILMIDALFYIDEGDDAGEEEEENTFDGLYVGILSALCVGIAAYFLVHLAKRVGYLQWEVHLLRLRDQYCQVMRHFKSKNGKENAKDSGGKSNKNRKKKEKRVSKYKRGNSNKDLESGSNTKEDSDGESTSEERWELVYGEGGRYKLENRLRALRLYQFLAYALFLAVTVGSAFIILVLGLKFDLDDENRRNKGVDVGRSASFRWLLSSIITEVCRMAIFSPVATLSQTTLMFGATEFCISTFLDSLMDSDNFRAIKAFDVFARVVHGYELKPYARRRLREIVEAARKRVLYKLKKSSIEDMSDARHTPPNRDASSLRALSDGKILEIKRDSLGSKDEISDPSSPSSDDGYVDINDPPIPPVSGEWKRLTRDDRCRSFRDLLRDLENDPTPLTLPPDDLDDLVEEKKGIAVPVPVNDEHNKTRTKYANSSAQLRGPTPGSPKSPKREFESQSSEESPLGSRRAGSKLDRFTQIRNKVRARQKKFSSLPNALPRSSSEPKPLNIHKQKKSISNNSQRRPTYTPTERVQDKDDFNGSSYPVLAEKQRVGRRIDKNEGTMDRKRRTRIRNALRANRKKFTSLPTPRSSNAMAGLEAVSSSRWSRRNIESEYDAGLAHQGMRRPYSPNLSDVSSPMDRNRFVQQHQSPVASYSMSNNPREELYDPELYESPQRQGHRRQAQEQKAYGSQGMYFREESLGSFKRIASRKI